MEWLVWLWFKIVTLIAGVLFGVCSGTFAWSCLIVLLVLLVASIVVFVWLIYICYWMSGLYLFRSLFVGLDVLWLYIVNLCIVWWFCLIWLGWFYIVCCWCLIVLVVWALLLIVYYVRIIILFDWMCVAVGLVFARSYCLLVVVWLFCC